MVMDTARDFGLNVLKNSEGLQVVGNKQFNLVTNFHDLVTNMNNFMLFYNLITLYIKSCQDLSLCHEVIYLKDFALVLKMFHLC